MKYLLPLFCLLMISLTSIDSFGQHEIHKKNGEILYVKIIEVGVDEIKYEDPYDQKIVRAIDKAAVAKLVMSEGREEDVKTGFSNEEFYADQRKKAVKLNFFSPLSNYFIEASYERSVRPGRSMVFSAGFIGVGRSPERFDIDFSPNYNNQLRTYFDEESAKGLFLRAGMRFLNTPNYVMRGMRYSHLLKGTYVQPEVVFGTYFYDEYTALTENGPRASESTEGVVFGGVIINLGKQWVFDDIFLLDLNGGVGYGGTSNKSNGAYAINVTHSEGLGMALRGSLSIGVLLK